MAVYVQKGQELPKEITVCYACGAFQDMRNGLGRGACSICYTGLLAGWSGNQGRTCSYAKCTDTAVARGRGRKPICRAHADHQGTALPSGMSARFDVVDMPIKPPLLNWAAYEWLQKEQRQ